MRLFPREEKFFSLFGQQVELISEASGLLLEGVQRGNSRLAEVAKEIIQIEHKGDEVIHEIFTRLNQTFITPLDPEDIHSLSSSLDDVLDGMEDAAHRMVAYRLNPIPSVVITLCDIINNCCKSLQKAINGLENNNKEIGPCIIEINRLENEADRLVREAVTDLFDREQNAVMVIKLKEVYEFLEATTDRCEDVADVLQNVIVKNS